MAWIELSTITDANKANEISDQLVSLGAEAVTFQDSANQPIFEPDPETPLLWHKTKVTGLFNANHLLFSSLEKQNIFQINNLLFQLKYIADEDWERRCLNSFQPIQCGKRLWICPSWHTPPNPQDVNVILDPGLAFGTGTHPTTSLCLEWLDNHIIDQKLIIDYGCGSGILGIAALKLGAKKVLSIDNDPQALEATRANAKRNCLNPKKLLTQLPNQLIHQPADIVLANILAQPLMQLAGYFAQITKIGSKIVLSGILRDQTDQVIAAYQAWFMMETPIYQDEWARLEGIRQ